MRNPLVFLALLLGCTLSGCATLPSPAERSRHAEALAAAAGLVRGQVAVDGFMLTSFSRISRTDQPLTVYIEGDGFAWRTRSQPADDPTPLHPQALALAAADPSANVLYLARPCQFTRGPRCAVPWWTSQRFAERVVAAMDQALTQYQRPLAGQPLHLVGYSGGAAIAALLAERRRDVASLRSVAGNLAVAQFNRLHKTSAMPQSLDPIDAAPALREVPQIHFYGEQDRVVPAPITLYFAAAVGGTCVQVRAVPGLSHAGDWAARWPALLAQSPHCQQETLHAP